MSSHNVYEFSFDPSPMIVELDAWFHTFIWTFLYTHIIYTHSPAWYILIDEWLFLQNLSFKTEVRLKINGSSLNKQKDSDIILAFEPRKPSENTRDPESQGDITFSGPLQVSGSSGFAWAKRRFDDSSSIRSLGGSSSKSLVSEPAVTLHSRETKCIEKIERTSSRSRDSRVTSDGGCHGYPSRDLSMALFKKIDSVSFIFFFA